MDSERVMQEIRDNIDALISQKTSLGKSLWEAFLEIHPVDIADFLTEISKEQVKPLFKNLPNELQMEVFRELSETMKVYMLSFMIDQERADALHMLPSDELTDLFDHFSDEELKAYLGLLHKKEREKVLSLLKFDPESAGGIMDTDVLTLIEDFTVEKSIKLLQRLRPSREIHQRIFVTNQAHRLQGYIQLEDLVLQKPEDRIGTFMRPVELVAHADDDRETIAKKMIHYGLMIVPVVDKQNHFLGVIPSDTLVDVIVEEASEDVQKMAALPPLKFPYFEMSFLRLFYQRSYVLVALLIAESFSGTILRAYEATLTGILISFIPMLTSAGGNTGSQISAVVIQGMATGEFSFANMFRLFRREFLISSTLACVLGAASFIRVYFIGGSYLECVSVSASLAVVVFISGLLGSGIPFLLRRLNIDPAFSAGPFLATLMDILGILIYCYISKFLLFR